MPSRRACTVVPEGQSRLPYHSAMSISPPRSGLSFSSHQAGQQPSVKQLNLMRASKVWPMPPRKVPCSLPLKYLLPSLVARITRLEFPSRKMLVRLSRYSPMFSGRSQNTGFLMRSRNFAATHLEPSGAEPAGPSNSSRNTKPLDWASGGAAGGCTRSA
ncbi:Uncharacterised protein [Mycobacteroides abscessus subsp. abscessus]|nr:Uncharacterised protein [Mycobacteroides abscessus subsp. abscessus]